MLCSKKFYFLFFCRTSICSMNYFLYSRACLGHLTGCLLPIVHDCFESSWWVYTWSQGTIFVRKEIYPHIIMSVRFQFERPLFRYKEREERENVWKCIWVGSWIKLRWWWMLFLQDLHLHKGVERCLSCANRRCKCGTV